MSTTAKDIIFEEAARDKLLGGITKLSDVIASTLGPKGHTVGLDKSWGAPTITNDGGGIVKEIELADDFENMGVSMAKEVAAKMKEKCGDGTTTAMLLMHTMVQKGVKNIASGASPILVKRGMEKAVTAMIAKIDEMAVAVKGSEETRNLATAAASGDTEVGDMITEAVEKVGQAGVITIEEGKGTETVMDVVEGMQFDRGYLSPYFCTDAEKMIIEMANAKLLLIEKKVSSIHELLPVLQSTASTGEQLLIIAEDIEGDALATLVVNRLRGTLKVAAIKAPGFGDRRKAMLQDIAVMTGATVVSEDTGITLASLQESASQCLGSAEKITINKDRTTIVAGSDHEEAIEARVKQIEAEYDAATSSYDQEKLAERKAKLMGGVAVIRVGAATEPEVKHKKRIFEDSLNSTQRAIEEGVVVGGGVCLLEASQAIDELTLEGDEATGAKIVREACQAPARQLAENSGMDASVIIEEIKSAGKNHGLNVMTEQVEDLSKAGVIDPAKVVKNALSHAVSTAGIVLISEALMTDAKDEDES